MYLNRIQFQIGMAIPEFLSHFGTEAQCTKAIKAARWPSGFRCPRCNLAEHYVVGPRCPQAVSVQRLPTPDLRDGR
jgi:hypothetical protein